MSDISTNYVILGEKVKERRKELKMTMTELANETNLSQSAISMIENGLRQPTLQTIKRISQVLGYDFSKILLNDPSVTAKDDVISVENMTGLLDINILQFKLTLQLLNLEPTLPNQDLNNLVIGTILEEAKKILNKEEIKKHIEQHVTSVIKEEIDRKKRELDSTLNILDI